MGTPKKVPLVLGHPHFVMAKVTEVSRADLVGQHLGETAMQVTKVFEPLGPCLERGLASRSCMKTHLAPGFCILRSILGSRAFGRLPYSDVQGLELRAQRRGVVDVVFGMQLPGGFVGPRASGTGLGLKYWQQNSNHIVATS